LDWNRATIAEKVKNIGNRHHFFYWSHAPFAFFFKPHSRFAASVLIVARTFIT